MLCMLCTNQHQDIPIQLNILENIGIINNYITIIYYIVIIMYVLASVHLYMSSY